jgi:hypothetical protein
MGAIDITNVLSVVVGAIGSKLIDKVVPESIDKKIASGGKVAIGLLMPMLSKDGKTKNMLSGVGAGFIAVGSVELLNSFGVLSGLGAKDDDMLVVSLEGADDLSVINGADDLNVINGSEDVLADNVLADVEADSDGQNEFEQ